MVDEDDKGKGGAPGGPPQMAALLDATRARALSEQAVAIVPSGACNWADGCGLGRAQETR